MLRKTQSLLVSETIINILQNQNVSHIAHISGLIESYKNGSEHGHIIWALSTGEGDEYKSIDMAFYICQYRRSDSIYRRSDSICIYKGKYAMQGISEDAYSNPKFFAHGEYEAAAEWLALELQTMLPKHTK